MLSPQLVKTQIDNLVLFLVEVGLATDQNSTFLRTGSATNVEVTFTRSELVSVAMKKHNQYRTIYSYLHYERAFTVKMPDGALLQMSYFFEGANLRRHRLAFFPSPDLEEFQNNPELYLEDEVYADVIARNIVPFPIRFDFDSDDKSHKPIDHAKSHLTLGQYQNCRIPVSGPLSPFWFVTFVLQNFYHTAFNAYAEKAPRFVECFAESIAPIERTVIHMQVPTPK